MLLTNQLPRVRDKLGIDYDTIKAINPAIIYASITGIGTDNEREN
ncbi:CoA-transferase family III [Mameliella alba]|nr:CoA transferase family III [Mameliella alba]SDC79529.1 CoA-transferase family III [Mameliella alba]